MLFIPRIEVCTARCRLHKIRIAILEIEDRIYHELDSLERSGKSDSRRLVDLRKLKRLVDIEFRTVWHEREPEQR